jgi:hypothetical protein
MRCVHEKTEVLGSLHVFYVLLSLRSNISGAFQLGSFNPNNCFFLVSENLRISYCFFPWQLKLVGELNTGGLDEGLYFIETEG